MLVVQLDQTGTECSAALLDLLISEPLIAIEGLGDWVERAPAEAVVLGLAVGRRLEHVVRGDHLSYRNRISNQHLLDAFYLVAMLCFTYLGIQRGQQLLLRIPCPVYPTAARLLSSGDGHGVRRALWRRLLQLLRLDEVCRL